MALVTGRLIGSDLFSKSLGWIKGESKSLSVLLVGIELGGRRNAAETRLKQSFQARLVSFDKRTLEYTEE